MGTRSNIIVRGGNFSITLYRHWDGYPSVTGTHLLETLKGAGLTGDLSRRRPDDCAASFANRLLRTHEDSNIGERFDYEVTTEIHGDIEHLYVVRFTNCGWVEIDHAPIDFGDARDTPAIVHGAKHYTVPEFKEMVNGERLACNARIRKACPAGAALFDPVTI